MKKLKLLLLLFFVSGIYGFAADQKRQTDILVRHWLKVGNLDLNYPAFHDTKDVESQSFGAKELLQTPYLDLKEVWPVEKQTFRWNSTTVNWKEIKTDDQNAIAIQQSQSPKLSYFVSYISADQWSKAKLKVKSGTMFEAYLDGEKVLSNYKSSEDKPATEEKTVNMEMGKHCLLVKVLHPSQPTSLEVNLIPEEEWKTEDFSLSLSPKRPMTINDVLDGTKVKAAQISYDGAYVLLTFSQTLPPSDKTETWKEIRETETGKIVHSFRGSSLNKFQWLPNANSISYAQKQNGTNNIYQFDLDKGHEKLLAKDLNDLSMYHWAPNGDYIIYSVSKDYSEDWKIRKVQGMEDRLPWFRNRSFLYKLDITSGVKQRLTFGAISTSLHDISPDGKSILFSQSRPDYNEYPYDKQNLYRMDLKTFKVDTIWKDKRFSGMAQFSPNGKQLLVQGGPSCFGKLGENLGKQPLANNYDGQLYLLDLQNQKVEPITYNFHPSVNQAFWNKKDGMIYIKADDRDYVNLFRYNPKNHQFKQIQTGVDVIKDVDLSTKGSKLAYTGCSISTPYQAYAMDLPSGQFNVIAQPEKEKFEMVNFGKTEDWNFTKEDGKTIIGRVYYPPNFDPNKKYPLIVNYYAGTSPVERSFGGRYPLNLYAANGYIVYLLQPSGAIGFGQEFSAAHQNNWGKTTADEIIEGTKKFLKAHPFIDAEKVGCIGASYGGFMTMYLQTRTDIFAAAISHAGISSISSYWGEGYWGYSYSVNASGHSFPWNNKELYIKQSPLFNADKVTTPLLLIHGSVDTNVPPGESIQMYQALKLQGKDVELVFVKDQDHHILNYTQRILWNNTIFAYFNKYLKGQEKWWNELYPDKNL